MDMDLNPLWQPKYHLYLGQLLLLEVCAFQRIFACYRMDLGLLLDKLHGIKYFRFLSKKCYLDNRKIYNRTNNPDLIILEALLISLEDLCNSWRALLFKRAMV